MFAYNVKEKREAEFQKWLQSPETKQLLADVEKETGVRYLETYWTVMGFGECDCEDWWEMPDWSAFDRFRSSEAGGRLFTLVHEWVEWRPFRPRMMRGTRDVKVLGSPETSAA